MKLPYGLSNFAQIREDGYYYVDKTRYIRVLEEMPERFAVILRSRRFGKTLFLNMLSRYYDQNEADRFDALFGGLHIHAHPTPKRGSYLMLSFNFSGINTETLDNANEGFLNEVRVNVDVFLGKYARHFTQTETDEILSKQKPGDLLTALFGILRKKGMERSVYVLIDEYDHFANNILSQGKEMFKDLVRTDGYVRPFYEALKKGTESVVDRLFITGVMPILLDSLTSGFNIAANLSTDDRFNEMFGFTEDEITPILWEIGIEEHRAEIKTYYNGYRFSRYAAQSVYNSDMILYYGLRYHPERRSIDSIIDTNVVSDYRKIRAILSIGERDLEERVLTQIVEEGVIAIGELTELFILTHETEFRFDLNAISSLLFYMGYLTIGELRGAEIELRMPNLVLKSLYWDYMRYVLQRRSQLRVDDMTHNRMMRELLSGTLDTLIGVTETLLKGLSNRDYERFDEKYIKVVMLSLLSNVNLYIPRSEYEVNADGYVDLYLQPAFEPERSAHYFIELKYVKARASKAALEQAERDGVAAMRTYLHSDAARQIKNLQAHVLVFRKDKCAKRVLCE